MTPALLLLLSLARGPASCPRKKPNLTVRMAPSQTIRVWTLVTGSEEERTGVALFCDDHGQLLRRIEMPQLDAGELVARSVRVPEWPSPGIALISTYSRADGISVDPVLLTWVDGRLRKALPDLHLDFADALCVGKISPSSEVTAAVVEFISGDECFPCFPKRFQVTTYTWRGKSLRAGRVLKTRRKHKDWKSALRELGLRCPREILGTG